MAKNYGAVQSFAWQEEMPYDNPYYIDYKIELLAKAVEGKYRMYSDKRGASPTLKATLMLITDARKDFYGYVVNLPEDTALPRFNVDEDV